MSEAIVEKKAEVEPKIDPNLIDGDIGDRVIEGDEIFVIEEVTEKKDTKSDNKDDPTLEDVSKKDTKPKEELSDVKLEITDSMRLKMVEKKMGKMDRELAEASLTSDQIRKRVPLPDLKSDVKRQRSILSNIDKELNPDEWTSQNRIVTTLEGDITDKERDEKLDRRYKSKDNTDFLKNEKKLLAKKGFEFSDEQFGGIAAAAEDYLVDGMFTKESIRKGLIDIIGADNTDKMYEVSSEQKIREDLKSAASKVTKSTRITRLGINAKLDSYTKRLLAITEPDELEAALDDLNTQEYAIYKKARDRQQKK